MSSNTLSYRIDQITEERGKQVQIVEQYLDNLNSIDQALKELRNVTSNLSQHPQVAQKLKLHLQEFWNTSHSFPEEIISARNQLEKAKNRLHRPAITIGCSGQARVGKSTLLQTIGNLPEEAIPTGKGIPVTAVRSRLRHSHERKAILSLRDQKTFINEYIKPFHKALKLEEVDSFEDFKNFDYNRPELTTDENVDLMGRLKKMQAALPSYENQLTGETKIIEDLTQLRPWVAYPDQESENNSNCSRLYLAVKNVEIQCSFLLDVEKLMLVDLPGLGEVNVDAEEHHVQGLKNEVDLVLLILRPTDQSAYWGDKDRKALNLICQAVEGLSKPGNFVLIVINHPAKDEKDQELYQILINDVHKQLNENEPHSRYQVLTCNAKDSDSVREQVLEPALNHLIERLPLMDKEVIDSSLTQWQETVQKISTAIQKVETSLQKFPSGSSVQASNLIKQKAKEIRRKLASKLRREVLNQLEEEVGQEKEQKLIIDENLIREIEAKHEFIRDWAEQRGLGKGKEAWYEEARERFDQDQKVNSFADDEINRSRTFLTNTYSEINMYFDTKMKELFINISQAIRNCTGNLLQDVEPGKEALEKFLDLLNQPGDPFPSLREATEYLLGCGSKSAVFQSHLLPKVIEETQKFNPESFNFQDISYKEEQATELVLKIISDRVTKTSFDVQKNLKQNPFISGIRRSAALKFEDSLLRDQDADIQFSNFAEFYANEILAEDLQMIEEQKTLENKAKKVIANLQELLNHHSQLNQ